MKRALILLPLLASLLCFGADKRKQKKEENRRVEMADVVVHRDEKLITVDGRVRNSGEKTLRKLVIVLKFISPDGAIVTTQRGALDELEFEPGTDSEFKWQMRDYPRAVDVTFSAMDSDEREIQVDQPGPYPIQ